MSTKKTDSRSPAIRSLAKPDSDRGTGSRPVKHVAGVDRKGQISVKRIEGDDVVIGVRLQFDRAKVGDEYADAVFRQVGELLRAALPTQEERDAFLLEMEKAKAKAASK